MASNQDIVQKSFDMLLNNRYMDVATSKEGFSWVAAVYYAVDSNLNFYFVSRKDSRHGQHIQGNDSVAVSIYNSTKPTAEADGIQVEGKAKIVEDENLESAVRTLFSKRFDDEEKQQEYFDNYDKYAGDSQKKIFKIQTEKLYKVTGAYSRSEVPQKPLKDNLAEIEKGKGLGSEHHDRVV